MSVRAWTVLHLFAGIGGCTLGFKRAGLRSVGSIDFDRKATQQLARMTGTPAFCRCLATLEPAELRELVPISPDVMVMSPPCKSFSGCMPAARAAETHYVDMSQLALRGMFLAMEAWPTPPGLLLLENVPRIQTRGAPLLAQIVKLAHRYGYAVDMGTHDCGEIGGLAQHRDRFLAVSRHMARVPAFLRKPPKQRVRNVGEVLLPLPSPAADHGDHMHRLPLLSPLNWLRLALIPPGKDWRALPERVRIAGSTRTSDPRVGWDEGLHGGRPDSYGVGSMDAPGLTVRGRQDVQTSRASIADPRLAASATRFKGKLQVSSEDAPSNTITGSSAQPALGACAVIADPRLGERPGRQNGGFGVEDGNAPAHAVLGEGTVRNTRASVADPRLGCEQRSGSYGVQGVDQPAATVVGHHSHDNSPGSLADPRLAHEPRRGSPGVVGLDQPSPTIRGQHDPRTAPAAVVDDRGWPIPTHELVIENGEWVLYGPEIDLTTKRACYMAIARKVEDTARGRWHRPLTDRELFTLQGGPVDFQLEGPRSSSKTQAGVREWIGNMIPVEAAEAIGLEVIACLQSSTVAGFLRGADVWVERADAISVAEAP